MTDPKYARTDPGGKRFYDIPGHPKLLSATRILGEGAKPAIIGWSAKKAAERAVSEEDTWHAIQQEEGDEAACKWIARAAGEYTEHRRLVGSAVHHMCEHYFDLPGHEESYLDWFLDKMEGDAKENREHIIRHVTAFGDWVEDYQPEFVHRETTVFHPIDGWAGTLDALAEMNVSPGSKERVFAMGDYKTGGVWPEVALQLAAYRHASEWVDSEGGTHLFSHAAKTGFVLELKPGKYKVHWIDCGPEEYEVFLALKRFAEWRTHL